jgi:hypothetical protein
VWLEHATESKLSKLTFNNPQTHRRRHLCGSRLPRQREDLTATDQSITINTILNFPHHPTVHLAPAAHSMRGIEITHLIKCGVRRSIRLQDPADIVRGTARLRIGNQPSTFFFLFFVFLVKETVTMITVLKKLEFLYLCV